MNRVKPEPAAKASSPLPAASAADWPALAHRELVIRIIASTSFSRSERLSSFLTYICDMTLKGREAELNEQRIGHAVFGRRRDYDSSIDGIVRTQASRLRQRLDLYFEREGAAEPVRISMPKGRYVPLFQPRHTEEPKLVIATDPAEAAPASIEPAAGDLKGRVLRMVPWLLCGLLACVVALLAYRDRPVPTTEVSKIASHPLWSRVFTAQQPTLDVPADSGLVLSHRFDQGNRSLLEYLAGDFRREDAGSSALSPQMKALRADVINRRYTSIVDLEAAVTLAQLAQSAHSTLLVRYARDLRPNDLKSGNVILMGAFESNPWMELFERSMAFSLRNDYQAHIFSVLNRTPQSGEPAHWDSVAADPQKRVYGVVAFVPNLSGSGNALIVEGTSMAGTEAAWDFVSDDSELLPFLKRIQHADGSIPHFELVLANQNMSSSAVRSTILAWRARD